jgi:hypothetical protein
MRSTNGHCHLSFEHPISGSKAGVMLSGRGQVPVEQIIERMVDMPIPITRVVEVTSNTREGI